MSNPNKKKEFHCIYERLSSIKLKHFVLISNACSLVLLFFAFIITFYRHEKKLAISYITDDTKLQLAYRNLRSELLLSLGATLLLVIVSSFLLSIFLREYKQRVMTLKKEMHKVATGNFELGPVCIGQDEISVLYEELDAMIHSIQELMSKIVEEQVQKELLNSRQKDVEFKMLASQINPHFLYNTLETIRMKARVSNQPEIEDLVKMLAKIMRRNIQVGDNLVTFKSEVELMEYYLKIQSYRFGERIQYNISILCDISHEKIMPLIIQPIVENAYVHGLEAHEGPGNLTITIDKSDHFTILVEDNGIGIPVETLQEISEHLNDFTVLDKSHIGLSNVNQRIKLRYGSNYGIHIESAELVGTKVWIELPGDMSSQ